jgi:tRNA threonylcarbamoyladenosine biosynthesis protein TsaB
MRLLAIETSSPVGSIALLDGEQVAERFIDTPREQSNRILPLIDDLLAAAGLELTDLDALAYGRGPGSFTGLRVAAAVTQGLALASGRPVVAVSSLEALAQRAWRELGIEDALLCVDARMREVYLAHYIVRGGRAELEGEERLVPPAAAAAPEATGWAAVGDGWEAYRDALEGLRARASRVVAALYPSARDVLVGAEQEVAAGRLLAPESALPVYLRDESAWRK